MPKERPLPPIAPEKMDERCRAILAELPAGQPVTRMQLHRTPPPTLARLTPRERERTIPCVIAIAENGRRPAGGEGAGRPRGELEPPAAPERAEVVDPGTPKPKREKAKAPAKGGNPGAPRAALDPRTPNTARGSDLTPGKAPNPRTPAGGKKIPNKKGPTMTRAEVAQLRADLEAAVLADPDVTAATLHARIAPHRKRDAVEYHIGWVRKRLGIRHPGGQRGKNGAGPGSDPGGSEPRAHLEAESSPATNGSFEVRNSEWMADQSGGHHADPSWKAPAVPTVELGPIWPPLPDAAATNDLLDRVLEREADQREGDRGTRVPCSACGARAGELCASGCPGPSFFPRPHEPIDSPERAGPEHSGSDVPAGESAQPELAATLAAQANGALGGTPLPPLDFRPAPVVTEPAAVTPPAAVNEMPAEPARPRFEAHQLADGTWDVRATGPSDWVSGMTQQLELQAWKLKAGRKA